MRARPRLLQGVAISSVAACMAALGASCAHGSTDFGSDGGAGGVGVTSAATTSQKSTGVTSGPSTSSASTTSASTTSVTSAVSSGATSSATSAAATTNAATSSSSGGGACHDPCMTGGPLTPVACLSSFGTLLCSQDVCGQTGLDYCCTTNWDQACVDGVNNSNTCLLQFVICI